MAHRESDLLKELAGAVDAKQATRIVADLAREFDYTWRPVGDNEANYGLVNIGSDAGHALIERITNAIDAVIEREALRHLGGSHPDGAPRSPREAVELWLHVPGGRVANLELAERQRIADNVVVTLLESALKRRPSVMIRDYGVGLTPDLVPTTILSLSGTNKIDKSYLAGAYGQGGSTALAFSPRGVLFVSRRQPDLLPEGEEDLVSITFACYEELDPSVNKNVRYSYE